MTTTTDFKPAQLDRQSSAVGRGELLGNPELDRVGTGFLAAEDCSLTSREIAEVFAEPIDGGNWQFRPGISAGINYQPTGASESPAGCRVLLVIGIHEQYDLDVLSVETPHDGPLVGPPIPLPLAAEAPPDLTQRPVCLVGYPVRAARRNEPERIARTFRNAYDVERVQPGILFGELNFCEVHLLQHDCAMLGHSDSSCLVDLETDHVLGLHLAGRSLEKGTAIPLRKLQGDPLLERAGIDFNQNRNQQDVDAVNQQIQQLSHSGFWNECRNLIGDLYQRAFGKPSE